MNSGQLLVELITIIRTIGMNKKILMGVGVVVLMGASFWGGMAYAGSATPAAGTAGQYAGRTGRTGGAGRAGGGFAGGTILSKDATGITIKLQNGSTEIVLIGNSTPILKSAAGTTADLTVGTTVSINGTANSDGSVTAQSVQIRPAGAPIPGAGATPTQPATGQ